MNKKYKAVDFLTVGVKRFMFETYDKWKNNSKSFRWKYIVTILNYVLALQFCRETVLTLNLNKITF